MTNAFDKLDKSRLLGFDRDGDALWGVALPDETDTDAISQALGPVKPVGVPKPGGIDKADGNVRD